MPHSSFFPPHVLDCAARRVEVLARLPIALWPVFRAHSSSTSQATDLAAAALDATGGRWRDAERLLFEEAACAAHNAEEIAR